MHLTKQLLFIGGSGLIMFLTGCASISNFQSAKPLGKGNVEVMASVSKISTQNGQKIDIDSSHKFTVEPPDFVFAEAQAMVGITDRFDVGVKYTFPTAGAIMAKYCLVGAGKEKGFFLSPGLRVGYTAFPSTDSTNNDRVEIFVPINLSIYFNEIFSISLAPTYSGRFFINASEYENCVGGNFNFRIGKKVGFIGEVSYFRNLYWKWDEMQFGGSIYFPFSHLF